MSDTQIDFTEDEVNAMLLNLHRYSADEIFEINKLVDAIARRTYIESVREDLIRFATHMMPDYIIGKHHRILADLLMAIERGEKGRICVNIPPRHGKSQLVSILFLAWYLGRNPNKKVMLVSHTTDLAVDFGRKVRNMINSDLYREVFPDVRLASDSKSAGRWNTNSGGEFFACGIGSSIAGRGADLLLVDDPHSEQDVLNGNFEVFEKAYQWYTYGARTRLMPNAAVAIVQCMTGDTPVLMAEGHEKPLRDVRPGDQVASYDEGRITSSRVLNWANQGLDDTFTVLLKSGITLQANERHPFLVIRPDGDRRWTRLKHLKPGDTLVSLKGAPARARQKQNPVNVTPVQAGKVTTASTRTPHPSPSDIGGNTRGIFARLLNVIAKCGVVGTAILAIPKCGTIKRGHLETGPTTTLGYGKIATSRGCTASPLQNTKRCGMRKKVGVPYAKSLLLIKTRLRRGKVGSVSTTAMKLGKSENSSATTATSLSKNMPQCGCLSEPSDTLFGTDQIVEITPAGQEEVFDIQVERTENFIANGLVSHNTRWHQDDLSGRVVRDMAANERSDQWEVVEFPAILEIKDKTTGLITEKPLWPEFFDLEALLKTKASMPLFQWNSQYQQKPSSEEGAIVKREWWQSWGAEKPPKCEFIIMALDAAAETHNRADFTAITTWGVFFNDEEGAYNIILLNAIKARFEFPELKRVAILEYNEWEPDSFIVEKKSAGTALYQEMRRMGIPVQEFTPHRGSGDKTARLNSVTDIISSGLVWVPQTRWAEELVEEVAAFPFGSNDDLTDTMVMALMRFRQGGFIRLPSDEAEEVQYFKRRSPGYY